MKSPALSFLVLTLGLLSAVPADEPNSLAAAIDAAIAQRAGGSLAEPTTDAEYLRRVTLDFTGVIPTADEVRRFLADTSPNKRTQVLDRLLDSPAYPRRMAEALSVMLLERREGKAVSDETWQQYLREAFTARKPWDELVRELITADGQDDRTRPAIRFFVDGGRTDPHVVTQDFARLFLGLNFQCAQCHDHPTIVAYKQAHYYGLLAFLGQGKLVNDKQNRPLLREAVLKSKLEFVSVFMPEEKRATGPRLLDTDELAIPAFPAGQELALPAKDGLPGIPKFEPRKQLGEPLTSHRQFARNAVNRFWFLLFGRGLVHPLDLHHPQNAPSHPELLERLTDEFIAQRFDVRWLMRELALSAAYQRGTGQAMAQRESAGSTYRTALLRPLSPEQLGRSLAEAFGQRTNLDATPAPTSGTPLAYKDYANGRTPVPTNWRDLFTVMAGAFGQPAGNAEMDFSPSVEQAVFLAHDRLLRDWLSPRAGTLVDRLQKLPDEQLADELFLTFLSRPATADERNDVADALKASGDRKLEGLQDLCLSLVTTVEFRLIR